MLVAGLKNDGEGNNPSPSFFMQFFRFLPQAFQPFIRHVQLAPDPGAEDSCAESTGQ